MLPYTWPVLVDFAVLTVEAVAALAIGFMCLWNASQARGLERLGVGFGMWGLKSLLGLLQNLREVLPGLQDFSRALFRLGFVHAPLAIVAWGFLVWGVSTLVADVRPRRSSPP